MFPIQRLRLRPILTLTALGAALALGACQSTRYGGGSPTNPEARSDTPPVNPDTDPARSKPR
ncbi:MAG: hypothetical protein IBJ10_05045 [Phycisphaerales bacterium]|nr:hypothetical protein [Phycisphaerales bacterium]